MSLSTVDSIASADKAVIVSAENDDFRAASMAALAAFLQTLIASTDNKITQYAAPSATGFTVTLTSDANSKWLVLTPAAGYAAGTIVLPAQSVCVDKQEIVVNCTQSVTTLTINGNGSTVTGAPTTLAANAFFTLRFDGVLKVWYRVA